MSFCFRSLLFTFFLSVLISPYSLFCLFQHPFPFPRHRLVSFSSCRYSHSCLILLPHSFDIISCYLASDFIFFSVDKKNQLDVTFCILYFSSNSCSTCFGQQCAHHQELTTALCYSLVLVCAVAAGRLSRPVGSRCHFLYSLFLF